MIYNYGTIGLSMIDNYYTVIIIICILTMISLAIDVGKNTILNKSDIKWFRLTFILVAVGAACEYTGVLMDKYGGYPPLVHKLITLIEFSVSPYLPVCLARSCGMKRTIKPMSIIMLVNAILVASSLVSGKIFYIDDFGSFQRGVDYWLYVFFCGVGMFYILFVFVLIAIRAKLRNIINVIIIALILIVGQVANIIDGNINSGYFSICITAALLYIFIQNMFRHIMMETINIEKDISNHDALTKVMSRLCYDSRIKDLNRKIREDASIVKFALCECDLNNLKIINDTFGHEAGDKYIINCCKSICDIFKHSPVYRIGGDEFVAILQSDDYDNIEQIKKTMQDMAVAEVTKAGSLFEKNSYASGFAVFDSNSDKSFEDVMKRADVEMYHHKKILKNL